MDHVARGSSRTSTVSNKSPSSPAPPQTKTLPSTVAEPWPSRAVHKTLCSPAGLHSIAAVSRVSIESETYQTQRVQEGQGGVNAGR